MMNPAQDHELSDAIVPCLRALRARALRMAGSRSAAEDLVHDTVEKALRHRSQFCPGTNLQAWLNRIMGNLFIDQQRRIHRETGLTDGIAARLAAPVPEPPPAWHVLGSADVWEAIGSLNPPQRQLLHRFLRNGATYRELSEELGIPPATLGVRLLRARRKVRGLLEANLLSAAGPSGALALLATAPTRPSVRRRRAARGRVRAPA